MRHRVSLCFIVGLLFMFLYNIVSSQLALLLLINDNMIILGLELLARRPPRTAGL